MDMKEKYLELLFHRTENIWLLYLRIIQLACGDFLIKSMWRFIQLVVFGFLFYVLIYSFVEPNEWFFFINRFCIILNSIFYS